MELFDFEDVAEDRPRSSLTYEERLEAAARRRLEGNDHFRAARFGDALARCVRKHFESRRRACIAVPQSRLRLSCRGNSELFVPSFRSTIARVDSADSVPGRYQSAHFPAVQSKLPLLACVAKRVSFVGLSADRSARSGRRYQLALSYVDEELLMQLDGPHAEQATAARAALLLNAAACQLQLEDWHGAVAHCHEVTGVLRRDTPQRHGCRT